MFADDIGLSLSVSSQLTPLQPKIAKKITKTLYFGNSRSFKIRVVNIIKKHVISACYDKQQHVCAYLQPFLRYTSQLQQNNHFLGGTPF